jgi:hypothetical protein
MSTEAASAEEISPAELADRIDRLLVADGLRDEWTLTDVQDVLADRGRSADPEDILVAFGVLDSGVWWHRAEREKLICTLRDAGAQVGVEPT